MHAYINIVVALAKVGVRIGQVDIPIQMTQTWVTLDLASVALGKEVMRWWLGKPFSNHLVLLVVEISTLKASHEPSVVGGFKYDLLHARVVAELGVLLNKLCAFCVHDPCHS